MRLEHYAAAAVLLALTACGGANRNEGKADQDGKAATSAAAGAAAGAVSQINPGEWEMTVETAAQGIPNLPAGAGATVKTSRSCISKAEASQPPRDMFAGGHKDCEKREYQVSGGTVHAILACGGASGGKVVITTDGSFGGDKMDVRSKIETSGQGPTMTISSHLSGHRVGECTAGKG